MRHLVRTTTIAAAAALLAGCGEKDLGAVSDGTSATAAARVVVEVTAAPGRCELSSTAVGRGTVAFVVGNEGDTSTSFTLFADGTDTIAQVDAVPAGETRTLLVDDVVPGAYAVSCTPDGGTEERGTLRVGAEPL